MYIYYPLSTLVSKIQGVMDRTLNCLKVKYSKSTYKFGVSVIINLLTASILTCRSLPFTIKYPLTHYHNTPFLRKFNLKVEMIRLNRIITKIPFCKIQFCSCPPVFIICNLLYAYTLCSLPLILSFFFSISFN
jgi:hypothetical protein